ncbi:hypothetical protein OSB04_016617 [Centaurea solstitialis]|uniref:TRF2/HOY1 PH-like domain-containing protein n=1 Tax=Centaurea solstitialis TaxID=347529 RepID=A0AA38W9Z1_9ASTR|nr:hypothetical protein OSB04_016617 [Centaurea solstitialis]
MRCDNNQNLYSNWEHNGDFDHHYALSASETFQGSSNNGGIVSASSNLNIHPQGGSPLGLSLRKSTSLINLVEMTLSQERQQKKVEKLKASNFPAAMLQIGSWKTVYKFEQRVSRNEGDLVAKVYYAKKKLVWELLDGPLKSKIEIQWSEISAIRAFMYEGEPGLLELELNQQPQFGREINPQPRKHTQWKQTTDFTQGQASICRRHSVIFPPGVLDKQYEKLLQCDNRLFNLSQQPFPVNNIPFFYHESNACIDYSYTNVYHRSSSQFLGDSDSDLPTAVMRFSYSDEGATRRTNENFERDNSQFQGIPAIPSREQDHFLPYNRHELWNSVQPPQTKTLFGEIASTGYTNGGTSSVDQIYTNSETEPTTWTSASDLYSVPWEPITEDFRGLYGNQPNNLNWT